MTASASGEISFAIHPARPLPAAERARILAEPGSAGISPIT